MTTTAGTHGTHVGVRELKSRLSHYLDRVKDGQTVVITERGREVARLVPSAPRSVPDRVKRLLEAGEVYWSGDDVPDFEPLPLRPRRPGEPTIAQTISEDRR